MVKRLKRQGSLAVSSQEQDRLAEHARTIFEDLQKGHQPETPKTGNPSDES